MRTSYLLESFVVHMNRHSLVGRSDKFMENVVLFICNLFFGLTKLLYQVMNHMLSLVSKFNVLTTGSPVAFEVATGLYNKLFDIFAVPIMLIATIYYFYQILVKSAKDANRFALVFLSVLALNIGFYHKGADMMAETQKFFNGVETEIVKSAVSPILVETLKKEGDDITQDSTEILQDFLFDSLIVNSFMTVNYGEAEFHEKARAYLIPVGESNVKQAVEEKELLADTEQNEPFFQSYKGIDKILISLITVFKAIVVGGVIVLINMMKIFIQLILVLMIFCLPLFSIMAFIPRFNMLLFRYLTQMLMLFSISPIVSILTLIVFYVFNVVDGFAYTFHYGFNGAVLAVATVFKYVFVILCWKNKEKIFSLLTTGNFTGSFTPKLNADFHRYSNTNPYDDAFLNQILVKLDKIANNLKDTQVLQHRTAQEKAQDLSSRDRHQTHESMGQDRPVNKGNQPFEQDRAMNKGYQPAPLEQDRAMNKGYQPLEQDRPTNKGYQSVEQDRAVNKEYHLLEQVRQLNKAYQQFQDNQSNKVHESVEHPKPQNTPHVYPNQDNLTENRRAKQVIDVRHQENKTPQSDFEEALRRLRETKK